MPTALCISATFLSGRYHGDEWPPSPARLLQAMLAGVMTGRYRALRPRVEPALRWLERQPAPHILAVPAASGKAYRLAVPNNDMDVIASEWAAGRQANHAELRTMKSVNPRLVLAPPPHVRYIWPIEHGESGAAELLSSAVQLTGCMHTLGWGVDMSFADAELLTAAPSNDEFEVWLRSEEHT